jgi:hypothetical protein
VLCYQGFWWIKQGEFEQAHSVPAWAQLAAETLPNHWYVELPRGGHALTDVDECIIAILLAFLTDPAQEPDAWCVTDAVRPFAIP